MKNLLVFVFTLCTLLSYGQNETNPIERKGFVIGFGIGGGVISVSDSDQEVPFDEAQGGGSFPNLKLGWMVNGLGSKGVIYAPRVGLEMAQREI